MRMRGRRHHGQPDDLKVDTSFFSNMCKSFKPGGFYLWHKHKQSQCDTYLPGYLAQLLESQLTTDHWMLLYKNVDFHMRVRADTSLPRTCKADACQHMAFQYFGRHVDVIMWKRWRSRGKGKRNSFFLFHPLTRHLFHLMKSTWWLCS